jgi:hypothetical protein
MQLIAKIQQLVTALHIEGRAQLDVLLSHLQGILLETCDSSRVNDILFATPASWRTFSARQLAVSTAAPHSEIFEHRLDIKELGLPQSTVSLCTADPLPALLEVLVKYENEAYIGRGESIGFAAASRPWTLPLWKEVAASVPADGLPLMLAVYSDACSVAGGSFHPILLEPMHFQRKSLDRFVTATMYEEPRLCKGTVLNGKQKAVKLQVFNLALDATFAWFHEAMHHGTLLSIRGETRRLYPRILVYDGDQPELVAVIGKTCYLCSAHAEAFDDVDGVCGKDYRPLTVDTLKQMRQRALHGGEKTAVAAAGMRHPAVNYRAWSAAHAPLIDPQVGGIARLVRADDLHVNVLGTVKKIFEDLSELLGREGVAVLNAGFCEVRIPPLNTGAVQLQRFSAGPWSLSNVRGNDLINFIWQCPEVLLRQRLLEMDLGHSHDTLSNILQTVALAREVLIVTHAKHHIRGTDVAELHVLIVRLRKLLKTTFMGVRDRWKFPKFHTMSAFITQIADRGVGSTYRGEATHRYLKQDARHTPRRQGNTEALLMKVLSREARRRADAEQLHGQLDSSVAAVRCVHAGGVCRALTEQSLRDCLLQYIAPQHRSIAPTRAVELYPLFDSDCVFVDACSSPSGPVIRPGKNKAVAAVNL